MSKYVASVLALYVGVRHIVPPKVLFVDRNEDPDILSKQTANFLFFNKVVTWLDCDNWCSSYNSYYWKRVNIINVPKVLKDKSL